MRRKRTVKRGKQLLFGTVVTVCGITTVFLTAMVSSAALHVPLPWETGQVAAHATVQEQQPVQKQAGQAKQGKAKEVSDAKTQAQGKSNAADGAKSSSQGSVAADGAKSANQGSVAASAPAAVPAQAEVQVAAQSQEPELYNGCEVTSLSMLISSTGNSVAKTTLAAAVRKDPTQEQQDDDGNTIYWGNPAKGFVGDVTGANRGYGVYHGPIADLLAQFLPGRADDLTGNQFDVLLQTLAAGKPLVVWTTVTFTPPTDWVTWNSPSGQVRATFSEHACLLVGYDADTVTVIDPLDGQQKQVNRASFEQSWVAMGRQAVTYK